LLVWVIGVAATTPVAQHNKSFCGAFFQKAPSFFLYAARWPLFSPPRDKLGTIFA
jgi:hypothetical protein